MNENGFLRSTEDRLPDILATTPLEWPGGHAGHPNGADIGLSRAGRAIRGYRIGTGPLRISLVGGCHADEPVGPRLLGRLVPYLASLDPDDPLVRDWEWWIVPHINPDAALLNASWQHPGADRYTFSEYLPGRVRELPGDDIEFGFPRGQEDDGARPEPAAVARWWSAGGGPFALHATLHGMAWAGGPWFLIEPSWVDRTRQLRAHCAARVRELGYALHDVERHGEKGFRRIEPGFATRPDSLAMRDHFLGLDDPETASRFRPSSMEFHQALGGDPLTLVSEMPLFQLPGVGEHLGPPDPVLEGWRGRIAVWSARIISGEDPERIDEEAADSGLTPLSVLDQKRLQWALLAVALETVSAARSPTEVESRRGSPSL